MFCCLSPGICSTRRLDAPAFNIFSLLSFFNLFVYLITNTNCPKLNLLPNH